MDFEGKRILVVEDDYFLANDLCNAFRSHHATVLGPAPTPFYASNLLGRRIDGAILDILLHRETVFELADTLMRQGTPLIFASAMRQEDLPERFRSIPYFTKPYTAQDVVDGMAALFTSTCVSGPEPAHLSTPAEPPDAATHRLARLVARAMQERLHRRSPERDRLN